MTITAIKVMYYLYKHPTLKVMYKGKNRVNSVISLMESRIRSTKRMEISVDYIFNHTIRSDKNHYGETPERAGDLQEAKWADLEKVRDKIEKVKVPVAFKQSVLKQMPKAIQADIIRKDVDLLNLQ